MVTEEEASSKAFSIHQVAPAAAVHWNGAVEAPGSDADRLSAMPHHLSRRPSQVVLPLPGHSVIFPANKVADVYSARAAKDGVSLESSPHGYDHSHRAPSHTRKPVLS